MHKPKYFTARECFPIPALADWRRFDDRILKTADLLREDFGPMTGNEGILKNCGLRTDEKYRGSQHFYGRALDLHPKRTTAEKIRVEIIKNPGRYPHITFLEIDVSWLHIDCRNGDRLLLWSPKRGFVARETYIETGDRR